MVRRQLSLFVALLTGVVVLGDVVTAQDDVYADLPDPTRPLRVAEPAPDSATVSPAVAPRTLTVSSIVMGADTRFAVINDRRVKEGDVVDGMRVSHIRAREVIVEQNGVAQRLRLLANETNVMDKEGADVN